MSRRGDELATRKALLMSRSTLYRLRIQLEAGQLQRSILTPQAVLHKLGSMMRFLPVLKVCVAVVTWVIAARRRGPSRARGSSGA